MDPKMLSNITYLIKKNGGGIVALALIFMMVYSWFPKMERTMDNAINKVNVTMKEITNEFKEELREQRKDNKELIQHLIEQNSAEQEKKILYQARNPHE